MERWQNFFLQRMGSDTNGSPYPVCESVGTWGVWCKDIPFKVFGNVKEPAGESYHDEHGRYEYIGDDGLYMDSYTMKVELCCMLLSSVAARRYGSAVVTDVRSSVVSFLNYLRRSGMLKLYSSHTRIGRQEVRLKSVLDDAVWHSDDNGEFLIFSVEFEVNDPVTDISLK